MANVLLACGFLCQSNRALESSETPSFCIHSEATLCLVLARDQCSQRSCLCKLYPVLLVSISPWEAARSYIICHLLRSHSRAPMKILLPVDCWASSSCPLFSLRDTGLVWSIHRGLSAVRMWPILTRRLLAALSVAVNMISLSKTQKEPTAWGAARTRHSLQSVHLVREARTAPKTKDSSLSSILIKRLQPDNMPESARYVLSIGITLSRKWALNLKRKMFDSIIGCQVMIHEWHYDFIYLILWHVRVSTHLESRNCLKSLKTCNL
jgi:hypothetical protein